MKFANEDEKHESYKERNKLSYVLIAFHQGVSYISQLAIQYFFKDELKVEPSQLATINSITHIPWAIKPILGLITDLVPICGYRRKIYIILCGIINLLCWLFMTFYTHTVPMATVMIFLVNLSLSFCSVLGEAVVVELSKMEKTDKNSKAKDFVSTFFLCRTIGELLSSYLKGLFVDIMPLRKIFFIACFVPSLIIISGFILVENQVGKTNKEEGKNDEEKISLVNNSNNNSRRYNTIHNNLENGEHNSSRNRNESNLFHEFITFMCQKYVVIPLAFIIIFKSMPSYYDAFFYFITNELKFTASDLGKISFCSTIAILIAIWIYKAYLKEFNFKTMITIGTIVSFFVSFLCYVLVLRLNLKIGVPDFWLLLFTNSFLSLIGELVLLPILSLACVLCPKNLEGTIYSIFMSSLNLGGIFSQLNGSLCTSLFGITSKNYDNLHWFILFAKFLSLMPLPILLCINNNYFEPKEKEIKEDSKEEIKDICNLESDSTNYKEKKDIQILKTNSKKFSNKIENSREYETNNNFYDRESNGHSKNKINKDSLGVKYQDKYGENKNFSYPKKN